MNAAETRFRFAPALAATVATVIAIWLVWRIADIILLLFVAVLVALYLDGVAGFLTDRLRLPHHLSFTAAVVITLGALVGLGALLVPPLVEQTRQLASVLPDYVKGWQGAFTRLELAHPALGETIGVPGQFVGVIVGRLESALAGAFPTVVNIGSQVVNIASILVMGIYLALYPGLYREWLIALFPPVFRDAVREILGDLTTTLRAWIIAQGLAMLILGLLTALGLWLLDVPYALTFGVFTGFIVIVPFFGTLIGTLLPAIFVLGGPGFHGLGAGTHSMLVLLLGVVIHIVEGNLVVPLVTAKRVDIPPVIGLFAVLVVARLLGLGGVVVAMPLAAATMVIVRRVLIDRVYEGQSFGQATHDGVLVVRVPVADGSVIVPAERVDVLAADGATPAAATGSG